jgi:membrane fusion protein, multidrug efflux system
MVRLAAAVLFLSLLGNGPARAQPAPGAPPAVGVVRVESRPVTETADFVGRVQAMDRVDITARVSAFIAARLFIEGTEIRAGDPLYRLERAPFEAAVAQQDAAVALAQARLDNAEIQLARSQSLVGSPASLRSALDDARANQRAATATLQAAQAQLRSAQINLDYTDIRAPIAGRIGRGNISVGNVVSPSSGALATIVSQDPIYVVFSIAVRTMLELQLRYADKGGMSAVVVRIRLPDGRMYEQDGKIDYTDPSIAANTDTILLRARIPNPSREARGNPLGGAGETVERPLTDGEFVAVSVQGIEKVPALAIPRSAVLSDVQGDYVYVVDAANKVTRRTVRLGQSMAESAVVLTGLTAGEMVVADGLQRVRPGITVSPGPAAPPAAR